MIKQWLMESDFQPVVGHGFKFRMPPSPGWEGVIDSEVLVVEPLERVSYRWDAMGLESVLTWTLVPTAGGTLVRMEHSGFGPDQEAAYKGATSGWRGFFGKPEQVVGEIDKEGI